MASNSKDTSVWKEVETNKKQLRNHYILTLSSIQLFSVFQVKLRHLILKSKGALSPPGEKMKKTKYRLKGSECPETHLIIEALSQILSIIKT